MPPVPSVPAVIAGFDFVPCTYKQARVMVKFCKDPTHLPGHFTQALRFFVGVMDGWNEGPQPFLVHKDGKQHPLDHPHRVDLQTMNPDMTFRVSVQPSLEAALTGHGQILKCANRAELLASVWDYYLYVLKTMWRLKTDVKRVSKGKTVELLTLKRPK